MDLIGALILFVVFIIFYIIIIAFFTMLFRLTGMTEDKARTQVISMLTNTGYTTREAETVLSSRQRRRLAEITILFGYSFTVIIVSLIVNVFVALNHTELNKMVLGAPFLIGLLFLAFFLTRNNFIRLQLDRFIEIIGKKIMHTNAINPITLIDTYAKEVLAEITLTHIPHFLVNKKLGESGLKEKHAVQIMLIKHSDDTSFMADGQTVLKENDILVVFGELKNIRAAFEHINS